MNKKFLIVLFCCNTFFAFTGYEARKENGTDNDFIKGQEIDNDN